MNRRTYALVLFGAATMANARSASAQNQRPQAQVQAQANPQPIYVIQSPPPAPTPVYYQQQPQVVAQPQPQPAPAQQVVVAQPEPPPPGVHEPSDHSRFVKHFGVGFFGTRSVPVAFSSPSLDKVERVDAPSLGVRYWFTPTFGLDAALGFSLSSGDVSVRAPTNIPNQDTASRYAVTGHVGVPIAIMHRAHYKLLVIPEASLGVGGGTNPGATPRQDVVYDSLQFDLGVRGGAEIHFGFINIPNLSLQATVGAAISYMKVNQSVVSGNDEINTALHSLSVKTAEYNQPWNIFTSNVAAIYYF